MLEKLKKKLEPSRETEEEIHEIKKEIIQRIEDQGYEAVAVGSTSRGTYLEEHVDIDIFFYFPEDTSREKLEEKGVETGKKVLDDLNPRTHYAEHPYVKGEKKGIEVEVVPCYKTKGKIKSAVDRSPLHNDYLVERLSEDDKKDARLLKKFMRNIGCYGAKEKVRGFSGFLCELLILRYGSFERLLKSTSNWKRGEYIDIEEHGEKSFSDPLVVIDPVDPDRNAAAALEEEKLGRFIVKARELLDNPTKETFESKVEVDEDKLRKKNLLLVTLPYPEDTVEEIAWSQLRKLEEGLREELDRKEFEVYKSVHWTDEEEEANITFDLRSKELPKYRKHRGPPVYNRRHAKRFKEESEEVFIEDGNLYSWREREEKRASELIDRFFQGEERIPSHYREESSNYEVIEDLEEILKKKELIKEFSRL